MLNPSRLGEKEVLEAARVMDVVRETDRQGRGESPLELRRPRDNNYPTAESSSHQRGRSRMDQEGVARSRGGRRTRGRRMTCDDRSARADLRGIVEHVIPERVERLRRTREENLRAHELILRWTRRVEPLLAMTG